MSEVFENAEQFPNNLFIDLGVTPPTEQPVDLYPTLLYVLNSVTSERNALIVLYRYKDLMTFESIGSEFDLTRQRTQMIVQDILERMKGKYAEMLMKGMTKYMDDTLIARIESILPSAIEAEKEELVRKTYTEAYNIGFKDGTGDVTAMQKPLEMVRVNVLDLSTRAYNALARNSVYTLGEIVKMGDKIMTLTNFGKGCFYEIADILESYGVDVAKTFPRAVKKFEWRKA